ncbi:MAG: endopeptidase La [Bdellovibrionaceae bacterium]|nr:endopeptidase La [Pseudobdellovibrionaceae bacterium]
MNQTNVVIPESLPMLPVRDIVIFPYMIIPLFVGREASIQAVEESLSKNRLIFLASQKEFNEEAPSAESIYTTGTVAMIMRMRKLADGRVKIVIQGVCKARIKNYTQNDPFFSVAVDKIEDVFVPNEERASEIEGIVKTSKDHLEKIIALGKMLSPDLLLVLDDIQEPGRIADLIASNLNLKVSDAQKVLETADHVERLKLINTVLAAELEALQMQAKIRTTAKDEMNKTQREYFLREQMKAIKNELGEADSKSDDLEDVRKRVMQAKMPAEVEKEALKQLGRLERMHPDASEASMIRTYLDWMTDLPWSKSTEDVLDLKIAKSVLESDHHGLEKAKDRILEFLAVRKLKKDNLKGPILCFAGPPGVGKTSLGKSIAKAMGRQYFRVALGGVKDEAEIRGHRRTYVGAMPGKIVQALKQCGTNNPVFVLDEIDKLGSDFRGDPSAAMLEVLDPEQNATFRDNYLNVDFDLSNVLFIATANVLENIPGALRDRMEVIQLSGYTENDKLQIARKHVVRKQIENCGLTEAQVRFTDDALLAMIGGFTREAGLRNLEREVGSVCRKIAKQVVMGEIKAVTVTKDNIEDFLGPTRFMREDRLDEDTIGVSTGLAWTQAGGDVLYVEAISMKGKGGVTLTGQMGDVMKESATAALSYSRAHADQLGIPLDWFENNTIHIHLPAGAIPKDGPSAGITMATAIISLITGAPAYKDVAMTGEVTLTGRVLPIGGFKEKALAAFSHGIKTVILPMGNKKDITEIPEEIRNKLKFVCVEHLDEVLQIALVNNTATGAAHKTSTKKKTKNKEVAA